MAAVLPAVLASGAVLVALLFALLVMDPPFATGWGAGQGPYNRFLCRRLQANSSIILLLCSGGSSHAMTCRLWRVCRVGPNRFGHGGAV